MHQAEFDRARSPAEPMDVEPDESAPRMVIDLTEKDTAPARTKICAYCNIDRPLYHFNKNVKTADEHVHICKACMAERRDRKVTNVTVNV